MTDVQIVMTRAAGLIPSLIHEISLSPAPVVLIPESFTLACEAEIISHTAEEGIFDLKIFSPSSFIREVRELTGSGRKRPVSGDGQNMIISRLLHHHREELSYYRDSVAQPTLAAKIASQLDDLERARLTPEFLRKFQPSSRRTDAKIRDLSLLWDAYRQFLSQGFEDTVTQWMSAVSNVRRSGLLRNRRLLIYGFDYVNHDLLNLMKAAMDDDDSAARQIVIGLVSDDIGPDRDIFRAANDSVRSLVDLLTRSGIDFSCRRDQTPVFSDPGIAYVEKSIYAHGPFPSEKIHTRHGSAVVLREDPYSARRSAEEALAYEPVPDFSSVRLYYSRNSYLECQHACQTLLEWHQAGIPWEDMAVAVCEQTTLPSLLPLTLAAAGIPFNAKQDQPMLMSACAQYLLSLLRILRLNFCQEDVLRLLKTGFSPLSPSEVMDMENYALSSGIHRNRWLKPFYLPEKESGRAAVEALETLRKSFIEPIASLRKNLSRPGCTGREAASLLFQFLTDSGVYERLLAMEDDLAAREDDLAIDRNRQVWTAGNELLDSVATFIGDEPLPLRDLCVMLEASLSSRSIKSLPQLSKAVMVAPPQMFFSSGIPCVIVMGLQENEISAGAGILSERERSQLEQFIEKSNQQVLERRISADADESASDPLPYSRIGQSLLDLAARQKQDIYQAVSLARRYLMISCSGAKPSGGILVPSVAFTRLAERIRRVKPENVTGGILDPDLRPFAPAFALESLAVRLRASGSDPDSFLRSSAADAQQWRDAFHALYRSERWRPKVEGVLAGLRIAVSPARITAAQARALYITHGMTISRVESFASCPYRHLLQYGLRLRPTGSFSYQSNDQGTFHHEVLRLFFREAMRHPAWPDLPQDDLAAILNRALKQCVRSWQGGPLTADTPHRYQGAAIIHGVRTSVASMMRAFQKKPHFLPAAVEVPFGTPDETGVVRIPALRIPVSGGDSVAFSGRIDRLDVFEAESGEKYFMIVDNKMSAKEVRQNSILAGLQLQLPLYLRAACEGFPGFEPAGGLYQPVRDVLVDAAEASLISAGIDKELQTSGMILDHPAVQEAARPFRAARRLDTNDQISVVTASELSDVMDAAFTVVTEQVNRIRSGEVSTRPVQDGQHPPCAWCDHADACKYDATLPGCRIPEISHKLRQDLR